MWGNTEIEITRMGDVSVNYSSRMYISSRAAISFIWPGKEPCVVPLTNHHCCDSRNSTRQTSNSILHRSHFHLFHFSKLTFRNTVPEIKDSLGICPRVFVVNLSNFGYHLVNTRNAFFSIVLIHREGAGIFYSLKINRPNHCRKGRGF